MRGQINVGHGLKIRKVATISDNSLVKSDLNIIKTGIKDGLLDSIFTLQTVDRDDSGKIRFRNQTITEIDEQIKQVRKDKLESIDNALYQISLFSKYLKKNVHASNDGYSASMILNFIDYSELEKLTSLILDEINEIKKSDFVEGKFNNQYGNPESFKDRLVISLENKYHLQKLEQN